MCECIYNVADSKAFLLGCLSHVLILESATLDMHPQQNHRKGRPTYGHMIYE